MACFPIFQFYYSYKQSKKEIRKGVEERDEGDAFLSSIRIQILPNKHKTSRPHHWTPSWPLFLHPATLAAAEFGLREPTPLSTAPRHQGSSPQQVTGSCKNTCD